MEYIRGRSLTEILYTGKVGIGGKLFRSQFYQCVAAIAYAGQQCGFTHYDLHSSNVISRLSRKKRIHYPLASGGISIATMGSVAVIIDLEHSYCVVDGIEYSSDAEHIPEWYGIEKKCRPLVDVFRLLCWCLYYLQEVTPEIYQANKWLLTYFGGEGCLLAREHHFTLPSTFQGSIEEYLECLQARDPDNLILPSLEGV